ncbi:hypothetical protein BDF14DRAFT_1734860, partial [Spinellus fusiger]
IRSSQIIGSVLGELWRAHWQLIFDDIPFSPLTIISFSVATVSLLFRDRDAVG